MTHEHTPGLLVAVRNSAYWEVDPAQDRGDGVVPFTVANFCASDPGNETGLQEANARRVAACWNACEGIPTDALEGRVVADMLEALRASQAALNPMSGFVRKGDKTRQRFLDRVRDKICAAIASATGGAA